MCVTQMAKLLTVKSKTGVSFYTASHMSMEEYISCMQQNTNKPIIILSMERTFARYKLCCLKPLPNRNSACDVI